MQLNKSQAELIEKILEDWQTDSVLSAEKVAELKSTISVRAFDWKAVAKYAFAFAILFGVIAVIATFADRQLIATLYFLMNKILDMPNLVLGIFCGLIAWIFFYFGQKRKRRRPDSIITNEGFILLGSAFIVFAAANMANLSGRGDSYFVTTFLLSTIFFGCISFWIKSQITWLLTLIALSSWLCVQSSSFIDWRPYLFGMSFVLRFLLFSTILLGTVYAMRKIKKFALFYRPSFYYAILLCLTSLWVISVFGNCGTWADWEKLSQIQLWPWALFSMIVTALVTYFGWEKKNITIQNFGASFLLFHIYTRYVDYCWDMSYKAVFFLLLALSFWFVGRSAEWIWHKGARE